MGLVTYFFTFKFREHSINVRGNWTQAGQEVLRNTCEGWGLRKQVRMNSLLPRFHEVTKNRRTALAGDLKLRLGRGKSKQDSGCSEQAWETQKDELLQGGAPLVPCLH